MQHLLQFRFGIRLPLILPVLAGGLILFSTSCKNDEDDIPEDCTGIHWEYEGEDGPSHWQDLCVGYLDCGGQEQSPIDIKGAADDNALESIVRHYNASTTHILNNGHTEQFTYDDGSDIEINGQTYKLLQFHFHTHSEHALEGKTYPMEIHLVHQNAATGNLAVIGVLFEEGQENPFLQQFITELPEQAESHFDSGDSYNISDVLPASDNYFTYSGSLTTPPCSEIVTWLVMEEPVLASTSQIQHFEELMHENYRPLQALNGRSVRHFH